MPVVQNVADSPNASQPASPTANRPASPIPIASPNASPIASSPGPDVAPVRQSVRPKKPPDYYTVHNLRREECDNLHFVLCTLIFVMSSVICAL